MPDCIATEPHIGPDEAALLARLRDPGQRSRAFGELVSLYGPRLHAHLTRMLHGREDADDVLQNALVKIYRNLDRFRGDSQLYSWMYRIATNEALGWLRKRRRKLQIASDEEAAWVEHRLAADPDFDGDEALRKLHAAIVTLPDRQREVFGLRYFDDMPYAQMSELLNISIGSLKASYHHAAKKIETYLRYES